MTPHYFPENNDSGNSKLCQNCKEGNLSIKTAKTGGAFIGCSNYPKCRFVRPLSVMTEETMVNSTEDNIIGQDDAGTTVFLKFGRYGPYVQRGEITDRNPKPKRTSIPKNFDVTDVTLALALQLLELPKVLGSHPDDGKPILSAIGPYGPYIKHNNCYANLTNLEEFLSIGMNRAVELIAEQTKKKPKAGGNSLIRTIGEHPDGGEILLMNGRYGPYLKYRKINVGIKNKNSIDNIDLSKALELFESKPKK